MTECLSSILSASKSRDLADLTGPNIVSSQPPLSSPPSGPRDGIFWALRAAPSITYRARSMEAPVRSKTVRGGRKENKVRASVACYAALRLSRTPTRRKKFRCHIMCTPPSSLFRNHLCRCCCLMYRCDVTPSDNWTGRTPCCAARPFVRGMYVYGRRRRQHTRARYCYEGSCVSWHCE